MSEWIACAERLPEEGQIVLTYSKNGKYGLYRFRKTMVHFDGSDSEKFKDNEKDFEDFTFEDPEGQGGDSNAAVNSPCFDATPYWANDPVIVWAPVPEPYGERK